MPLLARCRPKARPSERDGSLKGVWARLLRKECDTHVRR
jgi:hypothetical protein